MPRGAGTSLSGGALPLQDGILLGLSRMNRILEIDYENRCVVVQPGVTNAAVTRAVQAKHFYYAPDPSSQIACTIGGNVAENSGGIHCLKYGMTTHNLHGRRIGDYRWRENAHRAANSLAAVVSICSELSAARKDCWELSPKRLCAFCRARR